MHALAPLASLIQHRLYGGQSISFLPIVHVNEGLPLPRRSALLDERAPEARDSSFTSLVAS